MLEGQISACINFSCITYVVISWISVYFNFYFSVTRGKHLHFCYGGMLSHSLTKVVTHESYYSNAFRIRPRPLLLVEPFLVQRTMLANGVPGFVGGGCVVGCWLPAPGAGLPCRALHPSHVQTLNPASCWLCEEVFSQLFFVVFSLSFSVFHEVTHRQVILTF